MPPPAGSAAPPPEEPPLPPPPGDQPAQGSRKLGARVENTFSGTFDSLLGEIGDFIADFIRTWFITGLTPWRAGRKIVEDLEKPTDGKSSADANDFVSPSAYLVIASLIAALVFSTLETATSPSEMVKEVLKHATDALQETSVKVIWQAVMAVATGTLILLFAKVLGRISSEKDRGRIEVVTIYGLASSIISMVPVFAMVIFLEDAAEEYIAFVLVAFFWFIIVAPGLVIGVYWAQLGGWWPLRFVGGGMCIWTFVVVGIVLNVELHEYQKSMDHHDDVYVEFTSPPVRTGSGIEIEIVLFRGGDNPAPLCTNFGALELCKGGICSVASVKNFDHWLPPGEAVETKVIVEDLEGIGDDLRGGQLCCTSDDDTRCLRGGFISELTVNR